MKFAAGSTELTPGKLYCCGYFDDDGELRHEQLAWFASDGFFYDADEDEPWVMDHAAMYADAYVEQVGAFDARYTEEAQA